MYYMILHTLFHVFKLCQHMRFCPAKKKESAWKHVGRREGVKITKRKSRAGEFDDSWSRCRGSVGEAGEEEDGGKRAIKESILQH